MESPIPVQDKDGTVRSESLGTFVHEEIKYEDLRIYYESSEYTAGADYMQEFVVLWLNQRGITLIFDFDEWDKFVEEIRAIDKELDLHMTGPESNYMVAGEINISGETV